MTEYAAERNREREPTHPGVMLTGTVLPALGLAKVEAARLLGLSRKSLHEILAGRQPVTSIISVKLGKLCGNGPVLWLNMQTAYDLWTAEQAAAQKTS